MVGWQEHQNARQHPSRPLHCPPSMAPIGQRAQVYELRPPAPLRVRNRSPNYDCHPSRSLSKYRKDVKRPSSPLVNCSTYDEITLKTPVPVILTFPLASTLPESHRNMASAAPVRTGFLLKTFLPVSSSLTTDSEPDSDGCLCFETGIWPWLKGKRFGHPFLI
jgi:hypothetical protein